LIALSCAEACAEQGSPPALSAEDIAAVRRISDDYARAWLTNDSAAVMDLFSADAVLIPHLGNPHAVGAAAIRDHFWPPGTMPARVIKFERRSIEIRGSDGFAWDRGSYTLAFVYGRDTLGNSGNYVAVAKKGVDGRYEVAVDARDRVVVTEMAYGRSPEIPARITRLGGGTNYENAWPQWSRDGRRLVFASTRDVVHRSLHPSLEVGLRIETAG
jgi:uncharacterized protein (TIGR02246 family)